jgi:N-acetylglucosamine malate deacetylase 1
MIRNYLRHAYRTIQPLLYARRQFKLFLRTSLGNIDLRMQALASQTDYFSNFVRPVPIEAPFGKSMLIIAPHQDDEAIGCGGALALQVRSGKEAAIVMIYDGSEGHQEIGLSQQAQMEIRNAESRKAAAVLQMEPPLFLNHVDPSRNVPQVIEQLAEIITNRKADAIFSPYVLDGHPDHRITNYILAGALKQIPWNVRVFGYEVWGLTIPNVVVVIDSVIEEKLAMLSCFAFANQALDYVHSTKGLNMYRSRLLPANHCQYAECFFEVPRQEFIGLVESIQAAEGRRPAK